ncbi:MAG TPA: D-alanine--D-alanine ligase, partial [Candidatus Competibacteraceae bacterium]|nr:D-alanine--D-alanine ligase [Candidatus Competibacteraceae bacterium]
MKVTLLYDALEDHLKAEAEQRGEAFPLTYEAVATALRERGHDVTRLAAQRPIAQLAAQLEQDTSDLIFNLCESLDGVGQHEQHVAALLELLGKRFTGSDSFGLALAQDKALTKKLLGFHGIRYPKFSSMAAGQVEWADDLNFPLFVKPANQDASIGIDQHAIVTNVKALMERLSFIQTEFQAPALIEEFIEGREIYVGVLGGDKPEALPLVEWDFSGVTDGTPKIASAEAKWDKDSALNQAPEVIPNDIPAPVCQRMQAAAVTAFTALKLRDYGRIDLRLRRREPVGQASADPAADETDEMAGWEFYVIEVNPNPHLDPTAEMALAAQAHGLNYADFLDKLL